MPKVIVLCGPPGSGKSTFRLKYLSDFICVSTDNIILREAQKQNISYNEAWSSLKINATEMFYGEIARVLSSGYDFVVDRTNLDEEARKILFRVIPKEYKKVAIYFPAYSPKLLIERVKNRPEQLVPDDVIESMHKRYELPSESEGFHMIISSQVYPSMMELFEWKKIT